ncbi:hypothetical protein DICSQDRAFT_90406 [Dichomitus squalens LYAD-421 SS1]|uniref:Uncharacterized protein n=1 Tax=Dichomitus squalens (strain LYAD-421) TaxID=732165 RepID=R7SUE4_DICSQ|nr:uncharacterized protein DICSQDRAFT_90406 [Dichomitus squalens LYAD-421 SS1]EJF58592.1 hypothetical protein DICSQDRAFT_90406 [Dichomitus squalens LYAD-421 SS1]
MAPLLSRLVQLAPRFNDDSGVLHQPQSLNKSSFTLDSSGVAGFFGGDTAVSGMATVNLFKYRRWGGWYNTPGSYEIAKQYGQLANSRLWDGLFPGGTHDPSQLFGLDGKAGPDFLAARSGSSFTHTGHLAYLLTRKAGRMRGVRDDAGRTTTPASVTVVDLHHVPEERVEPPLRWSGSGLLAIIPIAASFTACVICALTWDWFCFASIALGIIASGSACFVLGSGKLTFKHHNPAKGAPPGDGILKGGGGVVVLRGQEGAVNSVTRGRYFLRYQPPRPSKSPTRTVTRRKTLGRGSLDKGLPDGMELPTLQQTDANATSASDVKPRLPPESQPRNVFIGFAAILLTLQFLIQLLLIPQGQLLGQILFVATLAVSWAYNTFLSSIDREDIQTTILVDDILKLEQDHIKKFEFGNWTAMSVFACLALQPDANDPLRKPRKLLDGLIPNDTEVWECWKAKMVQKLSSNAPWTFTSADWELKELDEEEQELLETLLKDAEVAYGVWSRWRAGRRSPTPATAVNA